MKVVPLSAFVKAVKHLDSHLREKLEKIIIKIASDPEIGKPLKYMRGERVVRMPPFRLIYAYSKTEDTLYLLKFEHRETVYK